MPQLCVCEKSWSGFLGGAIAQEESLAVSSALYPTLIKHQEMYNYNRSQHTYLYSDYMIYSPDVVVFRNDAGELIESSYQLSIITSPAVNVGAIKNNKPSEMEYVRQTMLQRLDKMFALFVHYDIQHLLLGAWGCGVFQNNSADVADYFAHYLINGKYAKCFKQIVFAVYDRSKTVKISLHFKNNLTHHNMNDKQIKHTSKFLSLILRHSPQTIGLQLDENGWAHVDELIKKSAKHHQHFTKEELEEVVKQNDKQRFAFNEDHIKIRANQGHSIEVELNLTEQQPPEYLYHGTIAKFIDSIKEEGLQKMSRQHVHLSEDYNTAVKVSNRRGKPVILTVHSSKMHHDGYMFYLSENGIWLTDKVPANYIKFKTTQ